MGKRVTRSGSQKPRSGKLVGSMPRASIESATENGNTPPPAISRWSKDLAAALVIGVSTLFARSVDFAGLPSTGMHMRPMSATALVAPVDEFRYFRDRRILVGTLAARRTADRRTCRGRERAR